MERLQGNLEGDVPHCPSVGWSSKGPQNYVTMPATDVAPNPELPTALSAHLHSPKLQNTTDDKTSSIPDIGCKGTFPGAHPHTSPAGTSSATAPARKMASPENSNPLAESGITIHTDSERYSATEDVVSTSPPSSSSSPVILYQPPTIWTIIRGTAINLLLPFINGMMLGFGELFAHEAAFRLGWGGTKVSLGHAPHHRDVLFPARRRWSWMNVNANASPRSSPSPGGGRIPSALASRFQSGAAARMSCSALRVWSDAYAAASGILVRVSGHVLEALIYG